MAGLAGLVAGLACMVAVHLILRLVAPGATKVELVQVLLVGVGAVTATIVRSSLEARAEGTEKR